MIEPSSASTQAAESAPDRRRAAPYSYDLLPGEPRPLAATQPDVLAVTAALAGVSVVPVGGCRVLEIGCGVGGNLLPMAQALPQSTFVGIDLSHKQIAQAQRTAAGAGLANVRLEARHFAALPADFGPFDYVVAHGLYFRTPASQRDRVLDAIAALLSPDGVAYVNYPTYPGWHVREIFREVLGMHAGTDPRRAPAEARELMSLFERGSGRGGATESFYGAHLREEAARLRSIPDDVLLHDYLEASSPGLFFEQFVDRLSRRGLDYVGEVKQNPARRRIAEQLVAERPQLAEDWLMRERYVDAIHGALARRSVICRTGRPVARAPQAQAIERLQLRALALPAVNQGEIQSAAPLPFRMPDGTTLQVADPAVKTVLVSLARAWPAAIAFEELLQVIRSALRLGESFAAAGSAERQSVLQAALACFSAGLIDLHQRGPVYLPVASERPTATPLARYQARESASVTNVLHVLVTSLNKVDRVVLSHLNGSRDRGVLATVLKAAVTKGVLPDADADPRAAGEAGWHGDVPALVEQSLAKLAGNALLVA